MKKFFSVWFVALLCGFTTAVSASVTVTLNCDPSDVSISGLTPDGGSWVKGENTCTTSYASVTFTAAADKLGKLVVTDNYGYSTPYTPFPNYGVSVYDNYKLEISCWDMSDVRDGSFTLNVADASKFTLTRSDYTTVALQDGNNTIAFASGNHESGYREYSFTLRTSESDVLVSVASSTSSNRSNTANGSIYIDPTDGATVNVYVYKFADIRTASVTVNVDEPSKLSVQRGGQSVYFTETTNQVYFVPTDHESGYRENQFVVRGDGKWYTVKQGENVLSSFEDSYFWDATDGATIDVTFTAPEVNVPVKFEGTIDAFSKVEVNGVAVDKATWSAADYSVKLGSEIKLYGDNTNYTLNSLSLNGTVLSDTYYFLNGSAYSFTVTETSDYTINLSATKLEPFDIYLTVNHPELFSVSASYSGSSPYDKVVVDEAEPNRLKVTLPAKTAYVYCNALEGCSFDSIKDGAGKQLLSYPSTSTSINVQADAEFFVWINKPERTDTLYVSFDYPEYLSAGGIVRRNNKAVITFKDPSSDSGAAAYNEQYKGWNKIAFDPNNEKSFYLSLYANNGYIYHNGEQKQDYYGNNILSSYNFTASNNDSIVVNILLSASFNIAGSATVTMVSPADIDPAKTWYVAPETEVQFTTNGSSVVVNNTDDIVADGDGVYTVTVSGNSTTIAIGAPTTTAIESVTIEKPRNNNVYTLQGILLIQNASEAQIDALPRGLYIINGEKRIVTNRR